MGENDYTTRDAARLLGVSVRTVQLWLEKGHLQGWKTSGGHRRLKRSSVEQAALARSQAQPQPTPKRSLNVLVVEDSTALLKLYRSLISRWPFPTSMFTACNGYEALVMVGKVTPDLLICDLRLPGITGFQVVRALCDMPRFRQLAIVVVSGMPLNEIAAHGDLPKGVLTMEKPIDSEQLQHLAQKVWQTRRPKGQV